MFQGTSLLTLDAKGRMTIPTRHREALKEACALEVTLTRHPDGCVLLYPRTVWLERRKALSQLPFSARVLQRIVMGSAVDLNVDAAGRLLSPAELRAFCSLEKDVALVGMGEHFELWNAEKLRAQEEAALEGLAAAAADFHF